MRSTGKTLQLRHTLTLLFLLPLFVFAQSNSSGEEDVTGLWKGQLYNDSSKTFLPFELAISEENGKLGGYSYVLFVIDGKEELGVKKIKIKRKKDRITVEDVELISNTYSEPPPKGVRMISEIDISYNDTAMFMKGKWSTTPTRAYSIVTGTMQLKRVRDFRTLVLYKKLEELKLNQSLSFVINEKKRNDEYELAEQKRKADIAAEEKRKADIAAEEKRKADVAVEEKRKADIAAAEKRKADIDAEEKRKADFAAAEKHKADIAVEEKRKADIAAEEKRKADFAAEEKRKADIAVEEKRKADIAAEEKRKADIASEEKRKADIAAAEKRKADIAAEEKRKADIAAEEKRKADIAVEEKRKADIAAEEKRKADIAAEEKRKADIAVEEKRKADIAAEEKHKADIAAEEKRKADIVAEEKRKADIAAEQKRKADIAAEEKRKADIAAEEKRKADIAAEQKRKADIAAEEKRKADIAAEQKRKVDIAAEEKRKADIARVDQLKKEQIAKSTPVIKAPNEPAKPVVLKPEERTSLPVVSKAEALGAAEDVNERKLGSSKEVYFESDSLVLTLYDNGEVDGDTVSVLMNGQIIFAKTLLTEKPNTKTIYINPSMPDTLMMVMYAESLGSIPPNTGLLIIMDGEKRYEVRFSADLKTNAGILLRRRKKVN
ncbi:MAG: hypothetical protein ABJB11_04545 [Ferruginibacter sp.]